MCLLVGGLDIESGVMVGAPVITFGYWVRGFGI